MQYRPQQLPSKIMMLLAAMDVGILLCAFFAMLFEKLNGKEQLSWTTVCIPLFLLEATVIVGVIIAWVWAFVAQGHGCMIITSCCCWLAVIPALITSQALLVEELDERRSISFVLIFIPVFVADVLGVFWLFCIHVLGGLVGADWHD